MLKTLIAINLTLFAIDRFFDLGVALPLILVLTIGSYLMLGDRSVSPMEATVLVVIVAIGALDLLDAGLLPVIRI